MTQARSNPSVQLEIISNRLPLAEPSLLPDLADTLITFSPESLTVLLIPGEASEVLVRLENRDRSALRLHIAVAGNFPTPWCVTENEGYELPPESRLETALAFRVPEDYFEERDAVGAGESLQLNYIARAEVYAETDGGGRRLLNFADLSLFVRPRSRYLRLLPQIYREVDFVGRFLPIIEAAFTPDVDIWANLWAYLDPLTAPKSMLPFLAHWVGWELQPYLSLDRQRQLIRYALEIYRWHGTRRGLQLYLHLATGLPLDETVEAEADKHIQIYETFTQGFVLGEARLGEDTVLGGGRPFHFIVQLRRLRDREIDETLVRAIIDRQKPAFCTYDLYIL